jgi:gas vesicle protein
MLEEQPLVLGALALAFGAALGGALPSSRTEDKMFGARSDRTKDALGRVAREEGEKLRATAGAVAEEARHIVDETSDEASERLPDGREAVDAAADRVTEAAGRLRDAGEKEAERQDLGHPKRSV